MRILNTIWAWQARRKLKSSKLKLKYAAFYLMGMYGKPLDLPLLLEHISDNDHEIQVAAIKSISNLLERFPDEGMESILIDKYKNSTGLIEKISIIEIMKSVDVHTREFLLAESVVDRSNDLQYAIVSSLQDTSNLDILNDVLQASNTKDLVLKRRALQTWIAGLETKALDDLLFYMTANLHSLIRATYELQLDGLLLKNILSHASTTDLPPPKAYPDFIIRYLTELLAKWEYDPEAYRSLHATVVPSYFTFSEIEGEQLYVIL